MQSCYMHSHAEHMRMHPSIHAPMCHAGTSSTAPTAPSFPLAVNEYAADYSSPPSTTSPTATIYLVRVNGTTPALSGVSQTVVVSSAVS